MKSFDQFWASRPGDILDPKSDHERTYVAGAYDAARTAASLGAKVTGYLVDIGRMFPGFDLMKLGPHGTALMIASEIEKLQAEIAMLRKERTEDTRFINWLEGHPYPSIGPDGQSGVAFAIAGNKGIPMREMIRIAMRMEQEANATNKDLN